MSVDPWATGQAEPEHRWHDRESRVHAAVLAEHAHFRAAGKEYCDFDRLPNDVQRDFTAGARIVLDTAYPIVSTAEEIEALPMGTLIQRGADVRLCRAAPLALQGEIVVGSSRRWDYPGPIASRQRSWATSAELAALGPWTVVHQQVAA